MIIFMCTLLFHSYNDYIDLVLRIKRQHTCDCQPLNKTRYDLILSISNYTSAGYKDAKQTVQLNLTSIMMNTMSQK